MKIGEVVKLGKSYAQVIGESDDTFTFKSISREDAELLEVANRALRRWRSA